MPYNIFKVKGGYKVGSVHRGLMKYYSNHPQTYDTAKKQFLLLERNYKYHGNGYYSGGVDSTQVVNAGTQALNLAMTILSKIPEANQAIKFANTLASFILKYVPDYRTPSTKYREDFLAPYGGQPTSEAYEMLVEKYGLESEPVLTFRYFYPGSTTDTMILYNTPNDPDSGLKYPLPIQNLYIYAQNLPTQNYKANFAAGAQKFGVNTSDPSFAQTYRNLYFDHSSLSANGHY